MREPMSARSTVVTGTRIPATLGYSGLTTHTFYPEKERTSAPPNKTALATSRANILRVFSAQQQTSAVIVHSEVQQRVSQEYFHQVRSPITRLSLFEVFIGLDCDEIEHDTLEGKNGQPENFQYFIIDSQSASTDQYAQRKPYSVVTVQRRRPRYGDAVPGLCRIGN